MVADLDEESAHAVARYRPKIESQLDDLNTSVAELLRQLPGVSQVEVRVRAVQPTHRIVHLRDYHFVPKDLYAIDMKSADIDRLHQELLLEVEAIQVEQLALLRCLIKHHGLRRIYAEGLTVKDLPNYKERVAVLRDMEKNQIAELRTQLAQVRELLKGMEQAGRTKIERYEQSKRIESEIAGMLDEHKAHLLELGAAGRLLIAGEIEEVLPLDDAELLERAKPITPDGRVQIDDAKTKIREDGHVKAALEHGHFALVILGGNHDLSDSVKRLSGGSGQYIRITTNRFREFSEEPR